MKKNTALVALAIWLMACPSWAQSRSPGYSRSQLKQNGFSTAMIHEASRNNYNTYQSSQEAPEYYSQSDVLPPIAVPAGSSQQPKQLYLPPITRGSSSSDRASGLSSQVAAPLTVQRPRPAPIVRSRSGSHLRSPQRSARGNEIYSQEPINLPPVTTLPVPSRTSLPPISNDTMMTAPMEDSVARVLACNFNGLTGLIRTTSADVSKAGSFKMGMHSSWFDLDRVYNRVLATGESGNMLELPLFFNYAVTDDLEISYIVPIVDYTIKSRILWNQDVSESGVGDSKLAFKYRVFDNPKYQMRGAFGLGFKFPTGNDDKGLGTGKTDFEIYAAFSKNFEKIVGHLNVGYIMTGDPNTQFYPNGLADKFYYNIGIEYPHTHNVTIMAEINGEDWGSEGMSVDVTPGIRYTPTENFSFDLSVPVSISNDERYGYNYKLLLGLTTFFQ